MRERESKTFSFDVDGPDIEVRGGVKTELEIGGLAPCNRCTSL